MKKLLLAPVVAVFFFGYLAYAASELDGKTYTGTLSEGKKVIEKNESLVFKDGKFRSTACDKYGFKEASYTTTAKGESTAFEAEAVNDKGEKMSWKGTVKGNEAKATGMWSKDGKASGTYRFVGNTQN